MMYERDLVSKGNQQRGGRQEAVRIRTRELLPSWTPGIAHWRHGQKVKAVVAWAVAALCCVVVWNQMTGPDMHWGNLAQLPVHAGVLLTTVMFSELLLVLVLANHLLFSGRDLVCLPNGRFARFMVLAMCPRLGLEFNEQVSRGTAPMSLSTHRKLWNLATVHCYLLAAAASSLVMVKWPIAYWAQSWIVHLESSSLQIILGLYVAAAVVALGLGVWLARKMTSLFDSTGAPVLRVPLQER